MANGRFDRLVAYSSAEPSSSTAHDMIGTRPGLRTQGMAVASVAATDVVVSVSVDMAAGPPASLLVAAAIPPSIDERLIGVVGRSRTAVSRMFRRCPAVGRRSTTENGTGPSDEEPIEGST